MVYKTFNEQDIDIDDIIKFKFLKFDDVWYFCVFYNNKYVVRDEQNIAVSKRRIVISGSELRDIINRTIRDSYTPIIKNSDVYKVIEPYLLVDKDFDSRVDEQVLIVWENIISRIIFEASEKYSYSLNGTNSYDDSILKSVDNTFLEDFNNLYSQVDVISNEHYKKMNALNNRKKDACIFNLIPSDNLVEGEIPEIKLDITKYKSENNAFCPFHDEKHCYTNCGLYISQAHCCSIKLLAAMKLEKNQCR